MEAGFAVVDVETTGLFPGSHRVAEIAIVHVDPEGNVTDRWETLVNPQRDLGPQRIHGIRAEEILEAPTFADIAPSVVQRLKGRVMVAHNLQFDYRFVSHELSLAGHNLPLGVEQCLCTMRLASQYLPGVGRSLKDCCDSFGIEIAQAHCAGDDAWATAHVLGSYMKMDRKGQHWYQHLDFGYFANWPEVLPRPARVALRKKSSAGPVHFLDRIVQRLPEIAGPEEHQSYLALLDRAVLDRHLSATEHTALATLATERGIGSDTLRRLNRSYLEALITQAWADGVVTEAEEADLLKVAALLKLAPAIVKDGVKQPPALKARDDSAQEIVPASAAALSPGDLIVLTGEMSSPRAELDTRIRDAGYLLHPGVTKKVKLLVAADPDSLSGKARKARDYGIPVVSEHYLLSEIL